jgi:hypothetical protein
MTTDMRLPNGQPIPTTQAGWRRLRLENGRVNKRCEACEMDAHPVRTVCSFCGGELTTPEPT